MIQMLINCYDIVIDNYDLAICLENHVEKSPLT